MRRLWNIACAASLAIALLLACLLVQSIFRPFEGYVRGIGVIKSASGVLYIWTSARTDAITGKISVFVVIPEIMIPYALALVPCLVLPAFWYRISKRLVTKAKPGVCVSCGYDLRATPNRCPECGAVMDLKRERAATPLPQTSTEHSREARHPSHYPD